MLIMTPSAGVWWPQQAGGKARPSVLVPFGDGLTLGIIATLNEGMIPDSRVTRIVETSGDSRGIERATRHSYANAPLQPAPDLTLWCVENAIKTRLELTATQPTSATSHNRSDPNNGSAISEPMMRPVAIAAAFQPIIAALDSGTVSEAMGKEATSVNSNPRYIENSATIMPGRLALKAQNRLKASA